MLKINDGNQLLKLLEALSNPYRLKILDILATSRPNVSQLARELGISRPLLYLHLQKLEEVRLIVGHLELSEEGKAMKYYEINPFEIVLNIDKIAEVAKTISTKKGKE